MLNNGVRFPTKKRNGPALPLRQPKPTSKDLTLSVVPVVHAVGAAVREEDALRAAAALAEAAIARLMGVTRRLLPLSQLLQKNLLRLQTHR